MVTQRPQVRMRLQWMGSNSGIGVSVPYAPSGVASYAE